MLAASASPRRSGTSQGKNRGDALSENPGLLVDFLLFVFLFRFFLERRACRRG